MGGAGSKVADRIVSETRRVAELGRLRQDLQQQGVGGVAVAHACDETARNAHGEPRIVIRQQVGGLRGEAKQVEQFARVGHRFPP